MAAPCILIVGVRESGASLKLVPARRSGQTEDKMDDGLAA